MYPHKGICFLPINRSSSQDFSHILWKTAAIHDWIVGKACSDSVFLQSFFHRSKFSTGVDNFVENDTHPARFVGYESRGNAMHFTPSMTHFTFQKTHLAENLLLFSEKWCIIYTQKTKITQEVV